MCGIIQEYTGKMLFIKKNKDQKCHYLDSNCPDIVLLFIKTNNIYAMQTSANLIDNRERDGLKRK